MTTPEIIQLIATVVGPVGVVWILSEKIKSQQDQMNAMKNNMESMKAAFDMIKIDEIEKYYDRRTSNAVQDALNNPDIYVVEEIRKLLKSDLASQKLANEVLERQQIFQKYAELLSRTCTLLKQVPIERRNGLIDRQYPNNAYEIKEQMKLIS